MNFKQNQQGIVIPKKSASVADFENLLQPSYFGYFDNWLQWLIKGAFKHL